MTMYKFLHDNNNGEQPLAAEYGLCRRLRLNMNTFRRTNIVKSSIFMFFIITMMLQQQQQIMPCSALMMTPTELTPPLYNANATTLNNSDNLAAVAGNDDKDMAANTTQSPLTATMTNKTEDENRNPNNDLQPYGATTNSPPALMPSTPRRNGAPPRVQLNKCCSFGDYLDISKTCVPGASDKWIPLIFLKGRQQYFRPQGSKPNFITFQDNVFPINQARDVNQPDSEDEDYISCTVEDLVLITGSNNIILTSTGDLYIPERSVSLPPSRYCVDQQAALVCFQKSKNPKPALKLRKCCGPHGVYDNKKNGCHVEKSHPRHLNLTLSENTNYQTIYGFPKCIGDSKTFAVAGDWTDSQLLSNITGDLHIPKHDVNLSTLDYCLEYSSTGEDGSPHTVKVFACLHHFGKETAGSPHQLAVLKFGLVISVIFLAATLVASYLMPSIHHVLHWRCQIYYVFCLFIAEFFLAFSQYYEPLIRSVVMCQIVASIMHFFFLSAFFWLNTMCFNIWWTFRDFRPSSLERNQELIRLRLYSAYAWGIPLLITAIAACVNLVPDSSLLRPGFGEHACWFNRERLSIFAYFFGPVGILISINIMLFISTTHQLTCGLWKRDDVKSTTEKTALGKVCLKLVVVMGVTWIVDVISWLVGGPESAWFVSDLINVLQGVFIFLVVGCQPQVWAACKRFCFPRSRQEITNTTNGVQHSSSSQGLPSMGACGGETTQNTSVHNTTLGSGYGGGGGGVGGNHIQTTSSTVMKIPMETVC